LGDKGGNIGDNTESAYRVIAIELQDGMAVMAPEVAQEVNIAIHDLLEHNWFRPLASPGGPYRVILGTSGNALVFDIRLLDSSNHGRVVLSLTPFQPLLKQYQAVCRSYHSALHNGHLPRLETLDHGRRGLHDEGAQLLLERLQGRIETDFATARRLFTLVFALSSKAAA
jgi:uncharacterized protein (UPF0262 family)